MNIGIPACGVVSATVKAATVIPGVVASSENVGDREFGERASARPIAWHAEQTSRANARPFCVSPISCACTGMTGTETARTVINQIARFIGKCSLPGSQTKRILHRLGFDQSPYLSLLT